MNCRSETTARVRYAPDVDIQTLTRYQCGRVQELLEDRAALEDLASTQNQREVYGIERWHGEFVRLRDIELPAGCRLDRERLAELVWESVPNSRFKRFQEAFCQPHQLIVPRFELTAGNSVRFPGIADWNQLSLAPCLVSPDRISDDLARDLGLVSYDEEDERQPVRRLWKKARPEAIGRIKKIWEATEPLQKGHHRLLSVQQPNQTVEERYPGIPGPAAENIGTILYTRERENGHRNGNGQNGHLPKQLTVQHFPGVYAAHRKTFHEQRVYQRETELLAGMLADLQTLNQRLNREWTRTAAPETKTALRAETQAMVARCRDVLRASKVSGSRNPWAGGGTGDFTDAELSAFLWYDAYQEFPVNSTASQQERLHMTDRYRQWTMAGRPGTKVRKYQPLPPGVSGPVNVVTEDVPNPFMEGAKAKQSSSQQLQNVFKVQAHDLLTRIGNLTDSSQRVNVTAAMTQMVAAVTRLQRRFQEMYPKGGYNEQDQMVLETGIQFHEQRMRGFRSAVQENAPVLDEPGLAVFNGSVSDTDNQTRNVLARMHAHPDELKDIRLRPFTTYADRLRQGYGRLEDALRSQDRSCAKTAAVQMHVIGKFQGAHSCCEHIRQFIINGESIPLSRVRDFVHKMNELFSNYQLFPDHIVPEYEQGFLALKEKLDGIERGLTHYAKQDIDVGQRTEVYRRLKEYLDAFDIEQMATALP